MMSSTVNNAETTATTAFTKQALQTLPIMMWNVNDVQLGYDKHMAKEFKLNTKSYGRDPDEVLPRLDVDSDIPYVKSRRQSH